MAQERLSHMLRSVREVTLSASLALSSCPQENPTKVYENIYSSPRITFDSGIIVPFLFEGPVLYRERLQQTVLFEFDVTTARTIIEGDQNPTDLNINSGGALVVEKGYAHTLQGVSTKEDPWFFANEGDEDTVKEKMPQIVFRGITPKEISKDWSNYRVETVIQPTKHIVSESPEVDETDGLHLFLRYVDQYNLYVVSLRKDGYMTIKRKFIPEGKTEEDAIYALIAEKQVFVGTYEKNRNLIYPFEGANFYLEAEIQNTEDGIMTIQFSVHIEKDGDELFSEILEGSDDGTLVDEEENGFKAGGPITSGSAGLRTDSIEFKMTKFDVLTLS